jgi:hypothetical protein
MKVPQYVFWEVRFGEFFFAQTAVHRAIHICDAYLFPTCQQLAPYRPHQCYSPRRGSRSASCSRRSSRRRRRCRSTRLCHIACRIRGPFHSALYCNNILPGV